MWRRARRSPARRAAPGAPPHRPGAARPALASTARSATPREMLASPVFWLMFDIMTNISQNTGEASISRGVALRAVLASAGRAAPGRCGGAPGAARRAGERRARRHIALARRPQRQRADYAD